MQERRRSACPRRDRLLPISKALPLSAESSSQARDFRSTYRGGGDFSISERAGARRALKRAFDLTGNLLAPLGKPTQAFPYLGVLIGKAGEIAHERCLLP